MDFQFLQNPVSHKWVILAPRRAKRPVSPIRGGPDVAAGSEPVCPFCLGREQEEQEVYRIGGKPGDNNWQTRVVPNKFPFAPIHEVIIHSPDHHKNFDELSVSHVELILKTYKNRFLEYQSKGQVYIFHNRGQAGGESLPHPHSQLVVVPRDTQLDIPSLDPNSFVGVGPEHTTQDQVITEDFYLFCPKTSEWPDEVWIAPKVRGKAFGEISNEEIADLAQTIPKVIQIFSLRHGHEFPFNMYIYPGIDWYMRIIPRLKTLGGFELGTGVYVNTQDPGETMLFLKDHFHTPDIDKILKERQAEYAKGV